MNKWLRYLLVLVAAGLLIFSILTGKLVISIISLLLTLLLKKTEGRF
ncbi:hypothetical protein [Heyndrickxia camelliae]|nr:hypothetical protein [Heyndrickxia camelliae]